MTTPTLREAAENAADVLDEARSYTSSESWSPSMTEECERAIRLLRVALAQPVPDAVAWHIRMRDCDGSADWVELGADKPSDIPPEADALPLVYAQPMTNAECRGSQRP